MGDYQGNPTIFLTEKIMGDSESPHFHWKVK